MLNIAHRGYSPKYPENTILAFDKAIEYGADGVELDVQLSKDGVIVVYHNELVSNLTEKEGKIKDYIAEELCRINILGSKETIITLETILKRYKKDNILYNIELKNSKETYKGIEDKVCKMVKRLEIEDKVIVSSFNHKSIKYIKERYPEIECGIITVSNIHNVTEYILNIGAEYFHPLLETATEEVCQKVNKKGIKINAWTDRKINSLDEVEALGLHGLISDYPEDVNRLLEKLPTKKH